MPADKWNRSNTTKIVQEILGIHGRVWVYPGKVQIGLQRGAQRLVIGGGPSFQAAIDNVFVNPLKVLEASGGREGLKKRIREAGESRAAVDLTSSPVGVGAEDSPLPVVGAPSVPGEESNLITRVDVVGGAGASGHVGDVDALLEAGRPTEPRAVGDVDAEAISAHTGGRREEEGNE